MKTFIKAIETDDGVVVRFREDGESKIIKKQFRNFMYIKKDDFPRVSNIISRFSNNATVFKAVNGDFVKIYLNKNSERYFLKSQLERSNVETFEADISAAKRYITDESDGYDFKNFDVVWLDFETMDTGTFDKDNSGKVIAGNKQILSCALIDEQGNEWYFKNEDPEDNKATSEYKLILDVLQVLIKYDVVAAWNGNRFDFPYLEQRMAYHEANRSIDFKDVFDLKLINKIDELEKFKLYTWTMHDSYSLENVSRDELDEGKVDFSDDVSAGQGKFYELFKKNPEKFKEYNMKDVILMKRLDDKLKYYITHRATCDVTKATPDDAMWVSHLVDNCLLRLNHAKNYICKSKATKSELAERDLIHIGGGFIQHQPGFYKNVDLFDFKSHYPLVIGTFNISQETFVSTLEADLDEVKELFNEKEFQFLSMVHRVSKQKDIAKFLKDESLDGISIMWKFIDNYKGIKAKKYAVENNLTWTPADLNRDSGRWTFHKHRFYTKEAGSLSNYVSNAVVERDKQKYYISEQKKINPDFKNTDEGKTLAYKDCALKVVANSGFGAMGLRSSRFFDYNVVDAITTCARWLIKKTMLFSKTLGLDIIYTHTDSCYLVSDGFKYKIDDLPKMYYDYYKTELFKDFSEHKKFLFNNPNTNEPEEHPYYCVFENDGHVDAMIPTGNARCYKLVKGEVVSVGGAMRKNDTNLLAKELQSKLCLEVMTETIDLDKWLEELKTWKKNCFDMKLDEKYLVFQKQYGKHHTEYGQPMIDKKTGVQKLRKDGTPRFAPLPVHIKLAKRLEEEGNELEVGDMLKYIIEKPRVIGYVSNSRKKVEREAFKNLQAYADKKNLSLDEFKELLDGNGCEYRECLSSTQYAITEDEYKNGAMYDADTYWGHIFKPSLEIIKTVYPKLCYEKFGEIWNMTEKQLEKEIAKYNEEALE